jgi:hypothetical protein
LAIAQQLRGVQGARTTHAIATQTSPEDLETGNAAGDEDDSKIEPFPFDRSDGKCRIRIREPEEGKEGDVAEDSDFPMDDVVIDGPLRKRFGRTYSGLRKEALSTPAGERDDARTFSLSSFSRLESAARLDAVQEATEVKVRSDSWALIFAD